MTAAGRALPVAALLLLLLLAAASRASARRRTLSDQRLAELQTRLAMEAMGGKLKDVRVGHGVVDVQKVGKRQSDQRLAELQTMAALEAMGGSVKHVPVGYGAVDVRKVGRKRAPWSWWVPDSGDWDQSVDSDQGYTDVDSAEWWRAAYSS
ncbi:uncharacterized protein LOC126101573 [Schistocerca cancellata]|uniref:uncharacterized protein LOC126101573 n=1 Tax=Schistocerca cancellata TaxID=274614 RepID=UPI0021175B80|nr:uncharacterized protein LOC126101573 [Schistocerca cancellata]